MIAGNRAVVWFLILILIFEPFLGIAWVFAEDDPALGQPIQNSRGRRRVVSPLPEQVSQASEESSESVAEEAITGSEKFLTSF